MNLYWIALAMIFSSLLGYRVAIENRLSGLTGLVLGMGASVLVATEAWWVGWCWLGTSSIVVTLSGVVAALCGLIFLVQKFKLLAYAKLIGTLVPFAVASIGVPKYAVSWNSIKEETVPVVLVQQADTVAGQAVQLSLKVTTTRKTPLYRRMGSTFVKTPVIIRQGAVLEVVGETPPAGGRWVQVILVRRDRSFEGFVPASAVE